MHAQASRWGGADAFRVQLKVSGCCFEGGDRGIL